MAAATGRATPMPCSDYESNGAENGIDPQLRESLESVKNLVDLLSDHDFVNIARAQKISGYTSAQIKSGIATLMTCYMDPKKLPDTPEKLVEIFSDSKKLKSCMTQAGSNENEIQQVVRCLNPGLTDEEVKKQVGSIRLLAGNAYNTDPLGFKLKDDRVGFEAVDFLLVHSDPEHSPFLNGQSPVDHLKSLESTFSDATSAVEKLNSDGTYMTTELTIQSALVRMINNLRKKLNLTTVTEIFRNGEHMQTVPENFVTDIQTIVDKSTDSADDLMIKKITASVMNAPNMSKQDKAVNLIIAFQPILTKGDALKITTVPELDAFNNALLLRMIQYKTADTLDPLEAESGHERFLRGVSLAAERISELFKTTKEKGWQKIADILQQHAEKIGILKSEMVPAQGLL